MRSDVEGADSAGKGAEGGVAGETGTEGETGTDCAGTGALDTVKSEVKAGLSLSTDTV